MRLNKTQQDMVSRHQAAPGQAVGRWLRRSPGLAYLRDDLLSAARLGLVEAALRYDAARGTKFGTYAYYAMDVQIRRAAAILANPVSVHRSAGCYAAVPLTDAATLPHLTAVPKVDAQVDADRIVNKLVERVKKTAGRRRNTDTKRSVLMFLEYLLCDATYDDVAKRHGGSRQNAYEICTRIRPTFDRMANGLRGCA